MKLLNSKIIFETSKKWALLPLFLVSALSVGIFSCSDDDSTEVSPDVNPDRVEAASAYFQLYTNETPGGTVNYINVSENIPQEADLSKSVELGIGVNVVTFGKHIYSINSNSSTITKWQVDKSTLDLSVAGLLSIASTGIAAPLRWGLNTINTSVIASETQAFIANFFEGSILEWNPTTMEIVKIHNIQPLVPPGDDHFIDIVNGKLLEGGKVMWTWIYFPPDGCCEMKYDDNLSTLAVLDPATGEFSYKYDERLPYGTGTLALNDGYYLRSNAYLDLIHNYFETDEDSSFYILKVDSEGNFDPSFEVNMSSLVDVGWGGDLLAIQGNEILFNYYVVDEWAEAYDDRWSFFSNSNRTEIINVDTGEAKEFTGFEAYNTGAFPLAIVDGQQYFIAYNFGEGNNVTDLLVLNSFDDVTLITDAPDGVGVEGFARLW